MSPSPLNSPYDEQHRSAISQPSRDPGEYADDDEPRLSEYRDILKDHRFLILTVVALALLAALAYVTLATPVYRANLLLQIEDSAPESKSFLADTTGLGELKTTASGEIQVIGSRLILGAAVDKVGLQISAHPRYIPFIGEWMARRSKELSNPNLLGMKGYVSGTEQISIDRFNVPPEFEDSSPFSIISKSDGGYSLTHELLEAPLDGNVGTPLVFKTPTGTLEVQISDLKANVDAEFEIAISSRLQAIERLQSRLLMSEQGRQSNVVNVSLEDGDRERLGLTLNAIASEYVRQNVDRKSAEAEKTLAFLNSQLPIFERQLKASEDAFARFRNSNGTIAFDEEAKVWLKTASDLQANLLELQQSRLELTRTNNNEHPKVQTLNQQISAVQAQLNALNKKIAAMPNMQRDALRLERDMRANSSQYQSMQNNALQMRLLSEGKIGNVRLLDSAVVSKKPVKPQKSLILAFALVLGILLGPAIAIAVSRTRRGIQNPREVSSHTGLELFAVIPDSNEQKEINKKPTQLSSSEILVDAYPKSDSVEALRGMRIGLKRSLDQASSNRILITGATPGIGKSFIASNFASLLAKSGKKILFIDADMRKRGEPGKFGLASSQGLTEILEGSTTPEAAIHRDVRPNLDVLTSGRLHQSPGDLFDSDSLALLLETLSTKYDHLIIDTAPILIAADALAIAPMCGCVLLVARADVSKLPELDESIRRLRQGGSSIEGLVMNGMDFSRSYNASYGYQNSYA